MMDQEAERLGRLSDGEWRATLLRTLTRIGDDTSAVRSRNHEISGYITGGEGLFARIAKATGLLDSVARQLGITMVRGNPTVHQLFYAPTGLVEMGYGALLLATGLALLAPTNTFGSGSTFRIMATLLPETVWGGGLLAAGLLALGALFVGSRALRRLGAFLATVLYGVMAVGFFLSNPAGIAYLQTALPFAGAAWVLIWGPRP